MKQWNSNVPGPGKYNPNRHSIEAKISHSYSLLIYNNVISITIGGRPKSNDLEKNKSIPGPGNYNIQYNENKKNGPGFGSGVRAGLQSKDSQKMPGPGAYNDAEASAKIFTTHKIRYILYIFLTY